MTRPTLRRLAAALSLLIAGEAAAEAPAGPAAPRVEAPGAETAPAAPDAEEAGAAEPSAPGPSRTAWRVELKYAATDRAAPSESSRTTLRGEIRPGQGPLSMLRVDLPWVNKSVAFDGDPLAVGLGDLALKASFRVPPAGGWRLSAALELKLPTAESAKLGSGKWVLAPSAVAGHPLPWQAAGRHLRAEVELSANVSVAGDPDRPEVGYGTLELKLGVPTSAGTGLELVLKPSCDWAKGGETAGVAELTGEWTPGAWRLALKLGRRLWGGAVGGSYDDKAELAVRRTF